MSEPSRGYKLFISSMLFIFAIIALITGNIFQKNVIDLPLIFLSLALMVTSGFLCYGIIKGWL